MPSVRTAWVMPTETAKAFLRTTRKQSSGISRLLNKAMSKLRTIWAACTIMVKGLPGTTARPLSGVSRASDETTFLNHCFFPLSLWHDGALFLGHWTTWCSDQETILDLRAVAAGCRSARTLTRDVTSRDASNKR